VGPLELLHGRQGRVPLGLVPLPATKLVARLETTASLQVGEGSISVSLRRMPRSSRLSQRAWVQFAPPGLPIYIYNQPTIQSNTVMAADEEMRDVIEEVEEVEREGVAPDDDFAEADASAGESDEEQVQEEFVDDDDDVEVRCKRLFRQ